MHFVFKKEEEKRDCKSEKAINNEKEQYLCVVNAVNVSSVGIPSSSSRCAEGSLMCPDTPQRR